MQNWPKAAKFWPTTQIGQKRNWPKRGIGQKRNWPKEELAKRGIDQKRNWPKEESAKRGTGQKRNWPKEELTKRGIGQKRNRPKEELAMNASWPRSRPREAQGDPGRPLDSHALLASWTHMQNMVWLRVNASCPSPVHHLITCCQRINRQRSTRCGHGRLDISRNIAPESTCSKSETRVGPARTVPRFALALFQNLKYHTSNSTKQRLLQSVDCFQFVRDISNVSQKKKNCRFASHHRGSLVSHVSGTPTRPQCRSWKSFFSNSVSH